ncbi:MAG: FUSC family protein [Curvibacter sp.]|nr:FUSC family protein [Curvibacter sp.]
MPHLTPLSWLLRLPAHLVNGLTVALGIGLVQVLFGTQASLHAAQLAASGAVLSSLADLPNTVARSWRRVLLAAVLGCASALLIALLIRHPRLLGLAIMALTFGAMMTMVWGPRAGPVSFAPLLSIVFTMSVPPSQSPWELVGWYLAGAAVYLGWSQAVVALLQARYRSLALASALQATAQLLRSRAGVMEGSSEAGDEGASLLSWLRDEALLADRLQAARDLLFAAPDSARARQQSAILLRAIDLRDILLASRLDLDLLGVDGFARQVRSGLALQLREMAAELDRAQDAVRGWAPGPAGPTGRQHLVELLASAPLPAEDPRNRLLPALVDRVRHLADDVTAIHALLRQPPEHLPLSTEELQLFVAPEGWPLSAFKAHRTLASPIVRHALRASLALGAAYYIGLVLPWASHPQWLVLSVAVVLRGNLEQTLSRRNVRVAGTLLGCLIVMALAHVPSTTALMVIFLAAAGMAHSFAVERYLVTASAATVMALLQAHLAHPATGFPIVERLADTVIGALMAWAFCFVLPSWERRSLPRSLPRLMLALQAYAREALRRHDPDDAESAVAQRLARRQAYDALGLLAVALQRSSAEPRRVQLPVPELTRLLDHAQRLMAHLSMVRLMRVHQGPELDQPEAVRALQDAEQTLDGLLAPATLHHDTAPAGASDSLELLPDKPPTEDLLPWLLRRLKVTEKDAADVAQAARSALLVVRRRRG